MSIRNPDDSGDGSIQQRVSLERRIAKLKSDIAQIDGQLTTLNKPRRAKPSKKKKGLWDWFVDLHGSEEDDRLFVSFVGGVERVELEEELHSLEDELAVLEGVEKAKKEQRHAQENMPQAQLEHWKAQAEISELKRKIRDLEAPLRPPPPKPEQVRADKLAEASKLERERDAVAPTISDENFRRAYINGMNEKIQKIYDSI